MFIKSSLERYGVKIIENRMTKCFFAMIKYE